MPSNEVEENDVNALINNLKNDDVNIRLKAVKALSEIRDQTAVKPLIDALETEQHDSTIANIFGTLSILKGENTKLFFRRYLELRNEKKLNKKHIRFYDRVIKTLVEFEDSEIDNFLYSIFTETDSQGKSAFADVFVKRIAEQGKEALVTTLEHEYLEVRWRAVKSLRDVSNKEAQDLILEEISKKTLEIQLFFFKEIKKKFFEHRRVKDAFNERNNEDIFDFYIHRDKFWLVKIKDIISDIFGKKWIYHNLEDSKTEVALVRALNEKDNRTIKDGIKDFLWNFGSEKAKSIFLDSELDKKIFDYIDSKDANGIFSIIHNYPFLEGEKVSYDNILETGMKGLEEIGTDEAIEKLLHFIRYTGGDYSGDESIYALHALDRIGTEDILQELYAKFLKGLTGIKNEFFIIDFVTIVGKYNLDLLLDIFSSPEEDFYLTPKKYNEFVLHLKPYIIDAFGTLKDPICIEPLVNAFISESDFYSDSSIKEALFKLNENEEATGFLLEKYNYYTNLLYTLFGTIKSILRSLNILIDFTDFSSIADIKHFNFYLTRMEEFLSSLFNLDSISSLENEISIDSSILDKIKVSLEKIKPEEQLRKTILNRFRRKGFTDFDHSLLNLKNIILKIIQENKYNSEKAAEEILWECYEQEEILSYLFEVLLMIKLVTHKLASALIKLGFKDLSDEDVRDFLKRNYVQELLHSTDNE